MEKANLKALKASLLKGVRAAGFDVDESELHFERTKTLEHGHYATNVAMLLAGKLKKNPREISVAIQEKLTESPFEKVEVAGPGFINLWIEQKFYSSICDQLVADLDSFLEDELELTQNKGKVMCMDYSHPNIAKPMGVHHLLSTIIGSSLIKVYGKIGYKAIGDNYLGDMGTQFGKLIYAIKTWGDEEQIEASPIDELQKLYVQFHEEVEKDESLLDFGRAEFKKFEEGDEENRTWWKKIVDWSKSEFQPIYDRLNVTFDYWNGESFYEDKMEAVLEDGRKKGVFVDGERGAWIVMPDDPNDPPAIVKKADGTSIYLTRDLAQTAYWQSEFQPELMVWVVDVAQSLHFRQRFDASKKLKQTSAEMVHVNFGRMKFKDGSMSTRKGNIIKLIEVLNEAEARALKLVEEKGIDLTPAEQKELARVLGVGSIKYNVLSQNRISNMTFEWDKMLSFDGNSAPYLMYTYARAKSILRKAEVSTEEVGKYSLELAEDHERAVAIDLTRYADALNRAADEFKPNHLANYLYQLAQDFNTLYNALPILKAEEAAKKTRLLLAGAVITVMEDAMGLLGIELPEKM